MMQTTKPLARPVWGIGWLVKFRDTPTIATAHPYLSEALKSAYRQRLNLLTARNGK